MKTVAPRTLDTPRLFLRVVEEKDCDDLCELYGDAETVKYTVKKPQTPGEVWRILAMMIGHWQLRGYGPYVVVEKASGKVIGVIGVWFPGGWPEPEIMYSLNKKYWGKGFAPEAAEAVREMVRTQLKWKRVISLIDPENSKSKSVARKLGGIYEKTIPFREAFSEIHAYDLSQ